MKKIVIFLLIILFLFSFVNSLKEVEAYYYGDAYSTRSNLNNSRYGNYDYYSDYSFYNNYDTPTYTEYNYYKSGRPSYDSDFSRYNSYNEPRSSYYNDYNFPNSRVRWDW